ncbi:MAG: protein kinase, partial [Magnetococcales bacterium]|nr:protein kinase [Magnetococcales bacterium]
MSLVTACPGCGLAVRDVPDAMLGRRMRCRRCRRRFTIVRMTGSWGKDGKAAATPKKSDTHSTSAPAPSAMDGGNHTILSGTRLIGTRLAGQAAPASGGPTFNQRIDDWEPGEILLDLYAVLSVLGIGGMGKVFKVRHLGWNMDLAVKVPKSDILNVPGMSKNIIAEAETWVNLGLHPNICSCYYVRELGKAPLLFAEFVTGGDLEGWIQGSSKDEGLPKLYQGNREDVMVRILDIAIQFAWGLGYAHDQRMIHQDIKPANVMLTPDGIAKVTDF